MHRLIKDGKIVTIWIAITLIRSANDQLEYIVTTARGLNQLSDKAFSNLAGGKDDSKGTDRNR